MSIETISVNSDQWGLLVSGSLQSCNDLVEEEARYHRSCLSLFSISAHCPDLRLTSQYASKRTPAGTFDKLCEWLEVCADQLYSVTDLHQIMQELAGHGAEHYTQNACSSCSLNDMKAIKSASHRNVACFKYMAFRIISDK